MEPHISEETRLNRSMIEAGEGSPTFRDEILPPDVLQPAAALTPVLQSLSSGSKRKRTPTHEGTTCTKKAAMDTDTRRPARSAPAAKKKATVDTGTGRPAPSATLLPPPPKIPHSSATNSKAGKERCPTSGRETLPPDSQHPDVTSTPTFSQFISSSGSKRKRTPYPTTMPQVERAEQMIDNEQAVTEC